MYQLATDHFRLSVFVQSQMILLFLFVSFCFIHISECKVHGGGSSYAASARSEMNLEWNATEKECLMKPSTIKIKCLHCAYSSNFAYLNPYAINLEQDKSCIPSRRDNITNEWRIGNQVESVTCGGSLERFCEATAYFVNKVMVAVTRGCAGAGSCMASIKECSHSGYGLAKSVCKSCCNEDNCNYWGNSKFYGGSIMTPHRMCSKSMSEVQAAMKIPVQTDQCE